MRKMMPVAQRVLGKSNELTLRMRLVYAQTLYLNLTASLDDVREAVTTIEGDHRIARRVLGGAHPLVEGFGFELLRAQEMLAARETPPGNSKGSN